LLPGDISVALSLELARVAVMLVLAGTAVAIPLLWVAGLL
jgi:hypothetical protein